ETSEMESRSRSVLDTPLEPVIGLTEGETRWRGMTTLKAEWLGCDLELAAPRVARKGEAWWGRKDSNLRSHKTADLQSAPFATRDTSPLNSIATHPRTVETRPTDDAETKGPDHGLRSGAFMGEAPRQSQPRQSANARGKQLARGPNCHYSEPMTQACHERSRSKA